MAQIGIKTVGDIFAMEMSALEEHFGRYGSRLFELACGIDHNPVVSNRVSKQISSEDTFPDDLLLEQCEAHIRRLAEKVWIASRGNARGAKTVGLKLKTKQFASLSRSLTVAVPLFSCEELVTVALSLCGRVDLGPQQLFGLVGVGLSNFQNDTEDLSPLFTGDGSLVVENGPLVETGELEP